ncbi:MAG: sugar transferase [Clostridiales Family XIII bacterium]|jgi:lipopolysaccharide/colanic/teichoic acid biosynthesis glycosyltransferase|nr:sugar transferase [Clostridiales Family XIII bacterium]
MYANGVKRILDFISAAILLVVLSWLLLILAALVAVKLGTPVLFRQERPGRIDPRTGTPRIFTLYKFRTMTDARYTAEEAEVHNKKIIPGGTERAINTVDSNRNENAPIINAGDFKADEERLTSFGLKLRRTSLDELPELVNILKGDMSFVGPRPLLVKYLPRYSPQQARRHEVRPGLTGLAQISGRNAITWEAKFAYDVRYAETVRFAEDCRILAATFRAVARRDGISGAGEATMSEFLGNDDIEENDREPHA